MYYPDSISLKRGDIRIYDIPHERVQTSLGPGTVTCVEVGYGYYYDRFGVVLDNNPLNYSPAFFFPRELNGYPPERRKE